MTCVIGLIEKDTVYIGADTASSNSYMILQSKNSKVFKKKDENSVNDFIFGCSTSFRMIQLLKYQLNIPEFNSTKINEETVDKYMCTVFIEKVRELFKDSGFSKIINNEENGGSFIVGFKGYLYEIESDFNVAKLKDNFCCIGSGYQYAYGAMNILSRPMISDLLKPEDRIEESLRTAAFYNPFVRAPFEIISLINSH